MKKHSYVYMFVVIFIFGIIILYILKNKNTDENINISENWKEQLSLDSPEVVLFNKIVNGATSIDDVKKCEEIKIWEIKDLCISQIKYNFNEMNNATNDDECEKLEDSDDLSKTMRQDICFLNLNYRLAKSPEDKKWCYKINDESIKDLCISQNDLKFKK